MNSCSRWKLPTFGLAWLLAFAFLLTACDSEPRPAVLLEGKTMGTQWHAALLGLPNNKTLSQMQDEIDQRLVSVNNQMSTWQDNSELSRFNQANSTDWIPASPELVRVVEAGQKISAMSDGIYDITVGPLVNLWGFGPGPRHDGLVKGIPTTAEVETTRARVGYQKLQVRANPLALKKDQPDMYVDLSSIAKGYGVDAVAHYFEEVGAKDYMIEIGGEVFARGKSPRGDAWRIAIEKPVIDGREVQQGVHLDGMGLATSGDYRNFFVEDGQRYAHTIDPKAGYPVKHSLASVSVLAENTMLADGYATMLMAMGEVKGVEFAEQHGLAAYFIWRTDKGFETHMTEKFRPILLNF